MTNENREQNRRERNRNRKIKWNPRPAQRSILKTDLPPTGVL